MRRAIQEMMAAPKPVQSEGLQQFEEKHYSVPEVAQMWGLSVTTIRRIFKNEPGVLTFRKPPGRGQRVVVTVRIPRSVVEGVHRRWQRG